MRALLPTSWGPGLAPESFSSRLENIAPFLPIAELPVETCDRLGLRTTLKAEDLATALELSLETGAGIRDECEAGRVQLWEPIQSE
jgi:hypothetical protein